MDLCPNNIDRLINNAKYNMLVEVTKLYKHFIERFNVRFECDMVFLVWVTRAYVRPEFKYSPFKKKN